MICKCKSTVFVYVNGTQYMCIDFNGHHSGGSSFVYVNDFCYYRNCLYTHRYKFSSEKKKQVKSLSPVSCASGRDNYTLEE